VARRKNTSSAGAGCLGYLLLNVMGLAGCLLALPVVLPDLMAQQTPPLEVAGADQWAVVYGIPAAVALVLVAVAGRGGRVAWWEFLLRTVVLLGAVAAAVRYTEGRVAAQPWNIRLAAEGFAAGAAALVVCAGIRWWQRSHGARPLPGEIWLAMVPLREDPERQLRHYCVVLDTGRGYADVAQITSKDKDGRRDHIRIPNDGWDEVSGRPHWVEIGREPRRVRSGKFLRSQPQGRCPEAVFAQLRSRLPGPRPATVPSGGPAGSASAAASVARTVARTASRGGLWSRVTRYLR
jgi:hypothetical protein